MFEPTHISDADPTVNDDYSLGFRPGVFWWNYDTNRWYLCEDDADGAAEWPAISGSAVRSWNDYTPSLSWTGATPNVTSAIYRYCLTGNKCDLTIEINGTNGIGASVTDLSISLPVDAAAYGVSNLTVVDFTAIIDGVISKLDIAVIDTTVADPGALTHPAFSAIGSGESFSLYYNIN